MPRLIHSAPAPFGPLNLCADSDSRSTPSARTSTGIFATDCTASVWNSAPRACAMRASSAIGWIVPISLLACITETIAVLSVSAASSASGATMPVASTGRRVVVQPRRASALKRREHRLVLDGAGDQVLPAGGLQRLGDAPQRKIVGLGAAAREHDFGRLRPDEVRDRRAGVVEHAFGLLTEMMDARRVAEVLGAGRCVMASGDGRVDRRRRVVVEIDAHR